ncbi:MAG: helix-turn-helix transcriptional regulator [Planctomycetes bacterium]|nr:helix-turn-helix transcriptional regulator [Planctomycetota bacterium]
MRAEPLLAPLSFGIPTYSMRHGRVPWPADQKSFMLYNDWDIFWVQRGEITVDLRDGRTLVAGPDEFAVLPPFVPAIVRTSKPGVMLCFCHFTFRMASTHLPPAQEAGFLGPGPEALLPLEFSRADAPAVCEAYRQLIDIAPSTGGKPWQVERALIGLVSELADFAVRRARAHGSGMVLEPRRMDPRLQSVRDRIASDPTKHWRVSQLASEVGLSPSRLHRLHDNFYGISLKHHIIETRLRMSLQLLRECRDGKRRSVREVSEACGFSSQNFFSRQFKSFFHISPLAYRDGDVLA